MAYLITITSPEVTGTDLPLNNGMVTVKVHVEGDSDIIGVFAEAYASGAAAPDPQFMLDPVYSNVGDFQADIPGICSEFRIVAKAVFANPSDPMGPDITSSQDKGDYIGTCGARRLKRRRKDKIEDAIVKLGFPRRAYEHWRRSQEGID